MTRLDLSYWWFSRVLLRLFSYFDVIIFRVYGELEINFKILRIKRIYYIQKCNQKQKKAGKSDKRDAYEKTEKIEENDMRMIKLKWCGKAKTETKSK